MIQFAFPKFLTRYESALRRSVLLSQHFLAAAGTKFFGNFRVMRAIPCTARQNCVPFFRRG
jgi:hypothetical protein